MKKPNFLQRLTGAVEFDEYDDVVIDKEFESNDSDDWEEDETDEEAFGELPVDMYQTGDDVVIRALVAGVSPGDLDISITRDVVTIKGSREEFQETTDDGYYSRELFWGSFSRTLTLPEEVLIDEAEAEERHGLLEIRLPKVDKNRSTRLKVKSGANR